MGRTPAVFSGGSVCVLWMMVGVRAWHLSEAGYLVGEFYRRTRGTAARRNERASFWIRTRPRRHLRAQKHCYGAVLSGLKRLTSLSEKFVLRLLHIGLHANCAQARTNITQRNLGES